MHQNRVRINLINFRLYQHINRSYLCTFFHSPTRDPGHLPRPNLEPEPKLEQQFGFWEYGSCAYSVGFCPLTLTWDPSLESEPNPSLCRTPFSPPFQSSPLDAIEMFAVHIQAPNIPSSVSFVIFAHHRCVFACDWDSPSGHGCASRGDGAEVVSINEIVRISQPFCNWLGLSCRLIFLSLGLISIQLGAGVNMAAWRAETLPRCMVGTCSTLLSCHLHFIRPDGCTCVIFSVHVRWCGELHDLQQCKYTPSCEPDSFLEFFVYSGLPVSF